MAQTQNDLNNLQGQVSSGQKSQTFDGLDGSIEQFTALSAEISRLKNYQQNNGIVLSQQQTSNIALGQIIKIATNIKSLIASQMSNTAGAASFEQQLRSNLSSITAQLNTTFQGNYIFGGTQTTTPPVADPPPPPVQVGVPDTSYYQGSTKNSTTRIADNQQITNNIRADDPIFQKLFAGITQALASGGNNANGQLQAAEDMVDSGLQGVIALQASVNANIVNIQQVVTQQQTQQTYFQALVQSISQSDLVSLSTQVVQDQTVLQASFATFARISSLSLATYLK